MAKIQFKRSNTAGKAPIATDLDLGELAINTNDGKLFLKKYDTTVVDTTIGRVQSVTSNSSNYVINTDTYDKVIFSEQSANINQITTTGAPSSGQTLWVTIVGTVASITFGSSSFEPSTVALPGSSTTRLDVGFVYTGSKWRCVAVA
jgi:hypothetical protein